MVSSSNNCRAVLAAALRAEGADVVVSDLADLLEPP
jgi:hypothetical protein